MATQTIPPRKSRRRRYMTFGTRSLFVFTALCGAATGWWTWPYEIEVIVPGPPQCGSSLGMYALRGEEPPDLSRREVRTMRRTIKGPMQHGRRRVYDVQNRLLVEDQWRFGVRHGLCTEWNETGRMEEQGHYLAGDPDGKWISHVETASDGVQFDRIESEYQGGIPTGTWQYYLGQRLVMETTFSAGVDVLNVTWKYSSDGVASVSQTERDADRTKRVDTHWAGNRRQLLEETHYRTIVERNEYGMGRIEMFGRYQREIGGYDIDQRHGRDCAWYENGNPRFKGTWHESLPVGTWRFWNEGGQQTRVVEFERGELVRVDGREFPRVCRLRFETDDGGSFWARHSLNRQVEVHFDNEPLDCLAEWLKEEFDTHNVKVSFREVAILPLGITPATRFSFKCHNLPLKAAVTLILEPLGLVAVQRFGQVWITGAHDEWVARDRTGVCDLRPKPKSRLAEELDAYTTFEFVETPLRDVLDYLQDLHGLQIDLNEALVEKIRAGNDIPVTFEYTGDCLRAGLGRLLDELSLSCEIRGETLTIKGR